MMSRRSDTSLGDGDREKDTSTSAVAEGFADRLDDLSSESGLFSLLDHFSCFIDELTEFGSSFLQNWRRGNRASPRY